MDTSKKPSEEQKDVNSDLACDEIESAHGACSRHERRNELTEELISLEDANKRRKKQRQAFLELETKKLQLETKKHELETKKHELAVRKFEWEKAKREKEYKLQKMQLELDQMKLDLMESELYSKAGKKLRLT